MSARDDHGHGQGHGEAGPRVGAVVLAAGRSSRMRGSNKLIQPLEGRAVVARVVDALLEAGVGPVVLVTGHDAAAVEGALAGEPVEFAHNPRWAEGMSTSLAAGIERLEERVAGALVCLGDMPRVSAEDVRALTAAFRRDRGRGTAAWVPVHGGRRGNPVLWAHHWFGRLRSLSGDSGARALLADLGARVTDVPVGEGVLLDADTPEELEELRSDEWSE